MITDFSAEALCGHVNIFCHEIGPRLATSMAERSAAYYVESCLNRLGFPTQRQTFDSIERFSKRLVPQFALSAAALGISGLSRGALRWLAGTVGLACVWHTIRLLKGYRALWEDTLSDAASQNVIARLAPQAEVRQRVVLVAHLDTNFNRLSFHPKLMDFVPALLAGTGLATLGGTLVSLFANEKEWANGARMGMAGYLMAASLLTAMDEFVPAVVGANDNASGAAVLLGLAERLQQQSLQRTEVWLVFSGAAEAGMVGIDAFIRQHLTELREATFVTVNAVGAGELCWVTDHSLSAGIHYHPHPEAAQRMAQVAQAHPELGVMGRPMVLIDETAVLTHYGLKGVTLTGYDRLTGRVPHQYRLSDNMSNVRGEVMARAAAFLWALLTEIDA